MAVFEFDLNGKLTIECNSTNVDQVKNMIQQNEVLSRFELKCSGVNLYLSDMVYGNDDELNLKHNLESLKKQFLNIRIQGTLEIGDDDYRRNYWYSSEPGSSIVEEDYAVQDDNSSEIIPLSKCWSVYEFYSDYGVEHCIITSVDRFIELVEQYCSEGSDEDVLEAIKEDDDFCLNLPYTEREESECLAELFNKAADSLKNYEKDVSSQARGFIERMSSRYS